MTRGKIFILSGPSGSGKTTIHEHILSSKALKNKLVRSISMTTRPRRENEKQGREYFFVSRKMFEYKIRAGHFLEWAKVFTNYYGTPAKKVNDVVAKGKSVLLCIDVQGAAQIKACYPEAISIFIMPPSQKELESRLRKRSTEDKKALGIRLSEAKQEMAKAKDYNHVVINKDLPTACNQVKEIILKNVNK
ncbi:MAG: guanylate kinase [Candidatus Omnitrophota bacterium]